MKCENYFCLYWYKNSCILDEISLDIRGCCEDCVYIDIEDDFLIETRCQLLASWERE